MYFAEFHHHLHQNGLPTPGGGKTVRAGPHPSHCHGRQATATAGQVGGCMQSNTLGCTRIFTIITMQDLKKKNVCQIHVSLPLLARVKLITDTALVLYVGLTRSIHCWTASSLHSLSSLSLMHLLIPTLYHMKYPADSSKNASLFNLTERPKTVQLLQEFMLDVLLMPYG